MTPDTQSHQNVKMNLAGNRNRLAAKLKRVNVLNRVVPATAGSRKILNLMLLAVVLPMLLLGVALVNFLASSAASASNAAVVNSQQVDLTLEGVLETQAQALASISSDPVLINAVFADDAIESGNESALVSQRLDQFLQVYSGFESLAVVNTRGEVAASAGILHHDFYIWQNTPAYQDSRNSQGRPSISPLKFGVLALGEDGSIDLSQSRIERLVFAAGVFDSSIGSSIESANGSANDGLLVGIMKSDVLVASVQQLLYQEPDRSGIPDSPVATAPESPASNDTNSGIQLLSLTSGEIAAVSSESTLRDAVAENGLGPGPASTGLSPFEETGTSWYSALPALSTQQSSQLLSNNVSLVLATGSILLAMAAAWFIVRAPQPAIAAFRDIASTADTSPAFSYSDAREASQRLVGVHESVRREMADYLHGHVQSKLVALSMSLGICQSMLTREPDQASLLLEQIQGELQKVQDEDIRRVSHELYPAIVKMGLVPAMRSLISRFNESMETDLIIDTDVFTLDAAEDVRLPEKQRMGIYRIAEEALNNVMKHANASHVEVALICNESGILVLSVTDDGCGFDSDDMDDSQGLAMMNDYAKAIGGQTEISSTAKKGTTVSLALPLETSKPISLVPGTMGETQFSAN
ncbi:MAG: ATP-binding protein [Chloroflexi bacterium]|nr:ATP-binding protein [Chloroflexota bacterium]MDA1218428.1 ATP-binding protein [Chloroflexota bacterium]PKB57433.1 MAG: hypothetical protein BZY73_03280 [SAR202 cluster bacterium Casp-Chloro-G3]